MHKILSKSSLIQVVSVFFYKKLQQPKYMEGEFYSDFY